MHSEDTIALFWAKVDQAGDCWLWLGWKLPKGYGLFGSRKNRRYAHRLSYEIEYGPIPGGLFVCHRCDNPPCVRPDHLFLGTAADNIHDMDAKGRRGICTPHHILRGIEHPRARLTEADVLAIRASSETSKALAAQYGVTPWSIRRIRRGGRWTHL